MELNSWYQQLNLNGSLTARVGYMNKEYFDQLLPLIPQVSNKVVLDLCCNAGLVSFEMARLGARVYGIEKNKAFYDQALYAQSFQPLLASFILADVESIDLSSYNPDLVMALSCLYHLKHPKAMIKKLAHLPCPLIVSFRNNLYDSYISLFLSEGRRVTKTASYAKKKAARLD